MVDLGCGHSFCKDCWSEYLKLKIIDEGVSESISCPASDCGIIVDDGIVMKLVKDKEAKIKYQHLMTDSYVEVSICFASSLISTICIYFVRVLKL